MFTFLRAGFCWFKMNDSIKDIDSMIRLAEIEQDKVKEDLGIGIYDSKSLEAIRAEGKSNVSDLIKYVHQP